MNDLEIVHQGANEDLELGDPFCCDLLSIAMSKAPRNCVWVTVMGNINTLAVATLTEVGCVILAEGAALDDAAIARAAQEDIMILRTPKPIFETALSVYNILHS